VAARRSVIGGKRITAGSWGEKEEARARTSITPLTRAVHANEEISRASSSLRNFRQMSCYLRQNWWGTDRRTKNRSKKRTTRHMCKASIGTESSSAKKQILAKKIYIMKGRRSGEQTGAVQPPTSQESIPETSNSG